MSHLSGSRKIHITDEIYEIKKFITHANEKGSITQSYRVNLWHHLLESQPLKRFSRFSSFIKYHALIRHTTACHYAAPSHLSLHCSRWSTTTFSFRQSEGAKIVKSFGPFYSDHGNICGRYYIYRLSRNLVISSWTVQNISPVIKTIKQNIVLQKIS